MLPRLIELAVGQFDAPPAITAERTHCFVWLDQVIAANVAALFPGMDVVEAYDFRVTRNADVEIAEEEAADLLRTIEQGVRQRRFGAVVRLTVQRDMPQRIRELLLAQLKLTSTDLYTVDDPLGLADLMALTRIDRPDLKNPPFYPALPASLRLARSSADIFTAIRQHDILLHHPYDSFQPLVELIAAAAEDPDVLAIKRMSGSVSASFDGCSRRGSYPRVSEKAFL